MSRAEVVLLLLLRGVLKILLLLLLLLSAFILLPLRMAVGFVKSEGDEIEGVNLGMETPPPPPPPPPSPADLLLALLLLLLEKVLEGVLARLSSPPSSVDVPLIERW